MLSDPRGWAAPVLVRSLVKATCQYNYDIILLFVYSESIYGLYILLMIQYYMHRYS